MNKKFSTLVAALLVSGLGFALVSSFNGLPMSDSPVAKAATANLRAVASEATEATAEAAFTEEAAPSDANAVWDLKAIDEVGNFTIAKGNFYVTYDATLSKDQTKAANFKFAAVDGYTIQVAYNVPSLYLVKDGPALKIVKEKDLSQDMKRLGVFTNAGVAAETVDDNMIIAPLTENGTTFTSAPMLTANFIASANLINGENYYIKDANTPTALIMQADDAAAYKFALSTATVKPYEEVTLKAAAASPVIQDALWTAKKIEVTGQAPRYQFTNLVTGKMLAFGLNKEETAIEFNPAGTYNTFEFEDESLTFKVTEAKVPAVDGIKYVTAKESGFISASASASAPTLTFSVPSEQEVAYPSPSFDDQIEYLNVTAGFGNGFGLVFKDDKLKDLAVEANVLSDASLITAVDYQGHIFLKVAGDFSRTNHTLEDFRASKFIVVDTVRYSSIIGDGTSYAKYFVKYAIAGGDKLFSAKGQTFDYTYILKDTYKEEDFKKGGKLEGVTRRLENADFTVGKTIGAKVSDPVYVHARAFIPDADNDKGLAGHCGVARDMYIAIKNFNGKNYVGAAQNLPKTPRWEYVFIGKNNDVDYTKVNGIVNIYSANYQTEGQIFANVKVEFDAKDQADYTLGLCDAKDVCANYPEGQFLVNYEMKTGEFKFTNRETSEPMTPFCRLKTVAGKDNVYAVVGTPDTIKIVPAKVEDKYDGYQNYDETVKHEMSDAVYTLAIQPTIEGLEKTPFYIKESHATDHKLSMTTEKADMAKFKLVKFESKTDTAKISVDMYITAKGVLKQDSAVAFMYAIYNADNNEYVDYNEETGKEFFYCNPNSKFNEHKATLRFLLKKKADGAYNLIAMGSKDGVYNQLGGKVFGASVANKLANEVNTYKITENDLITIKAVDAPEYRKIVAAPFDTIRIYKEGLENVALYAKTADKSIVSGEHFLGMTHKTEATKAQYSFFVDTAFVNRTNNNKYQYLLVLDADTVHGKVPCSDPTHAPHDSGRIDTVYGKFLVNAVDSIASWGTKHNNPYFWETENTPKLAFVNAAHVGDNLIIKSSMFTGKKALAGKDTIDLKNGLTKASFAFRIVDQATGSFVIETVGNDKKEGFIKWLNGTPVVVGNVKEAEIFNASKTTNKPTANEDLNTSAVTVIAGNGNVTILNAAGKTVVISNMLGQAIANTVLTSDNQTIAASGIVVVAVEGEEAVKAIIK